jgi:hypothetical protein
VCIILPAWMALVGLFIKVALCYLVYTYTLGAKTNEMNTQFKNQTCVLKAWTLGLTILISSFV